MYSLTGLAAQHLPEFVWSRLSRTTHLEVVRANSFRHLLQDEDVFSMRFGRSPFGFRSKLRVLLFSGFVTGSLTLVLMYQRRAETLDGQPLRPPCNKLQTDHHPGAIATRLSSRKNTDHKYNLMEEIDSNGVESYIIDTDCTLDYINANKLPQDHPCVINTIRQYYLNKPSPPDVPLKLDSDDDKDRSPGQTGIIFRLLKNQTKGFFVECGALDGEYMSNTIDLERKFNWSGILIEANPKTFQRLLARHRKAWTLPVCLSLEPFSTRVTFQMKIGDPGHSHIEGEAKTLQKPGIKDIDPDLVHVQCFPFYSVLLAVGRTQIDFFSLDVEGHELAVLKTIPWHKVDIKTMTVEWEHIPEGQEALSVFMEENGFISIGTVELLWSRDVVFMKDLINT